MVEPYGPTEAAGRGVSANAYAVGGLVAVQTRVMKWESAAIPVKPAC
ncbi:hypothetical protein RS9916_29049 [Synechococcus sp. RS9916]|nr:hypothetical protein RS9916_29049 [Synechococcus sp. RS9916]